jgi:2-isopropylmalate synthase
MKDSSTYEHVSPELVGNRQRVLVSDLSGRSNVTYQLQQQGLADRLNDQARRELLERVKESEFQGYDLEAADGTFELFVRQAINPDVHFFDVRDYYVAIRSGHATATVSVSTDDGIHTESATGDGPMNALDVALRKCLSGRYPRLAEVRLTDYKVRVLDSKKGTAAKVRVLVEWSDHQKSWSTVGVSDDVIEASWNALVDALRLELMRLTEADHAGADRADEALK